VPGVLDVALEDRDQAQSVIVRSARDTDVTAAAVDALQPVRLGVIASREPTLEDAYIAIVTSAEREDAR
jgi:ABC-2 type transport system ATP-binding protein